MPKPTDPRPPAVSLQLDYSGLAVAYARRELSTINFALALLGYIRCEQPALEALDDAALLRLVPGLPGPVARAMDAQVLADRAARYLRLPEGDLDLDLSGCVVLDANAFYPELTDLGEQVVVQPHRDPLNPGHQFTAWIADSEDLEEPTAGPWYGASPMAVLVMALDDVMQLALGQNPKERPDEAR